MKNCFYDRETNSIADLIDAYEMLPRKGLLITRINVPKAHRGQGHGTALLKKILEAADEEKINLYLEVSPSDGLNYNQLVSWYRRYGFRPMRKHKGLMSRLQEE
jgi:ribosomal protein S18 acetylase RimI-like enzyme